MDLNHKRRQATFNNPRWTSWAWEIFRKEAEQSRFYYTLVAEGPPSYIAGVTKSAGGKIHTVRLRDKKCTCLDFQELQIPCRHAQAVCREFKLNAEDYIDNMLSIEEYKATYATTVPLEYGGDRLISLIPLDLESLVVDPLDKQCIAPPINRTPGRPQRKRRERGHRSGHQKRQYKCSRCGSLHHRSNNCNSIGTNLANTASGQRHDPIELHTPTNSSAASSRSESPSVSALTSRLSESLQVTPVAQRNRDIATPLLEQARADLQARILAVAATHAQELAQEDTHEEEAYEDEEVMFSTAPETPPGPSRPRPLPAPTPFIELPPPIRPLQQAPKRMLTVRKPSPKRLLMLQDQGRNKGKGKAV